MSLIGCRLEADVHAAARSGRWPAALRRHAQSCRHCADVALATAALAEPPAARVVADPRVIWMQARLARRLRAQAQISRLVTAVQMALGLAVVGALLYVFVRLNPPMTLPIVPDGFAAAAGVSGLILAALFLVSRPRRT